LDSSCRTDCEENNEPWMPLKSSWDASQSWIADKLIAFELLFRAGRTLTAMVTDDT
jgi:hypothetical protein